MVGFLPQFLGVGRALGGRCVGAHQHAVAAGFAHHLDDQRLQIVERVFQPLGIAAEMGLDVGEQRLLAQVVANHVRHVGVDTLVVGNPGSRRVGDRHVAELVGVEEAGRAELRIGTEGQRVDEIVVDAAVDHVHLLADPAVVRM